MRALLLLMLLLVASGLGGGETLAQPIPCPFAASVCQTMGTGTPKLRSLSDRVADTINPKDFGATGDGTVHTAGTALGISTLSALVAYTRNGVTPYSWAGTYPFGVLFNLPVAQTAISTATVLHFTTTNTTAAIVAAGQYRVPMANVAGITQGQAVAGTNVAAGTQVEFVQPSAGSGNAEIWLSKAVAAGGFTNGETLTFTQPGLASVAAGMLVSGAGITGGTTVQSVNVGAGTVTLTAGTSAALYVVTLNSAGTPHHESSLVTFYRPWSNVEATALSMDFLGTQAAVQRASVLSGGTVRLPRGHYVMNGTVVFPLSTTNSDPTTLTIGMIGDGHNETFFEPTADFGWHVPLIACGDPSGNYQNGRGIFASAGTFGFCTGKWQDFTVTFPSANWSVMGVRPTIAGVPIGMDGVLQGPRRDVVRLWIFGFNTGEHFSGDHTLFDAPLVWGNFRGYVHEATDGGNTVLRGDYEYHFPVFAANTFANISIPAESALDNAVMIHPYIAGAPYGIYKEPGASATRSDYILGNVTMMEGNYESLGLAFIKDGNVRVDGAGGLANLADVTIQGGSIADANNSLTVPVGGGTWVAHIDIASAAGLRITDIANNGFAPVGGATAFLRISNTTGDNSAGVLLSGGGLPRIVNLFGAASQEIVSGAAGTASSLGFNGEWVNITLETPGVWIAHPFGVNDTAFNSGIAAGAVLEGAPGLSNASITGRPSGISGGGVEPILGVNLQPWATSPNSKFTIVASVGQHLPVAVVGAQAVGTLLKVSGASNGAGVAASSVTDGQTIGVVIDANGGSTTLVYVRSMIQGAQ